MHYLWPPIQAKYTQKYTTCKSTFKMTCKICASCNQLSCSKFSILILTEFRFFIQFMHCNAADRNQADAFGQKSWGIHHPLLAVLLAHWASGLPTTFGWKAVRGWVAFRAKPFFPGHGFQFCGRQLRWRYLFYCLLRSVILTISSGFFFVAFWWKDFVLIGGRGM